MLAFGIYLEDITSEVFFIMEPRPFPNVHAAENFQIVKATAISTSKTFLICFKDNNEANLSECG